MAGTGDSEEIIVTGLVQGVGFRPFVWRLARRLGLSGMVRNTGDRVVILIAGPTDARDAFARALREEAPPLARMDEVARRPAPGALAEGFRIAESQPGEVAVGVVPDIATCPACRSEVADEGARRHRYAFTNCTDCGPRFSIVRRLPYDRAATTMAGFAFCPACRAEYEDPADRRFHAQPVACPDCGPRLALFPAEGFSLPPDLPADAIAAAAALLKAGHILAVKGLGGFHIACDAGNGEAVAELRRRKHRPAKPLAVMADARMAERLAILSPEARAALAHPAAPIVLAPLAPDAPLAPGIAPGQREVGLMLPYTPLHHLLLEATARPLVMTSGNRSGEPQVFRDEDAPALAGIVDGFLTHDRPIARRLDDSVVRVMAGKARVIRRGRGLAPRPLALPADFAEAPPILATGGEMKSAICLTHGGKALLSHHLGDLDEPATGEAFEAALADYTALFAHRPRAIAVDLHPGYRATQRGEAEAARRGIPLIKVQHHHAHIAAVMAENGWRRDGGPVIGIALDGLGLGDDGTLWGGEVLLADYGGSRRLAALAPIPLAGGDAASREPWRVLLAFLDRALGPDRVDGTPAFAALFAGKPVATLRAMMAKGLNAPISSSAGRLFDAFAALLSLAPKRLSFEGEAAMALEALAGSSAHGFGRKAAPGQAPSCPRDAAGSPSPHRMEPAYHLDTARMDGLARLDPAPLFRAAAADLASGHAPAAMARAFHHAVADAFAGAAIAAARAHGMGAVALSGGVFQNRLLLEDVAEAIGAAGLSTLLPTEVPAGDGGLAFGQAAVAAARMMD